MRVFDRRSTTGRTFLVVAAYSALRHDQRSVKQYLFARPFEPFRVLLLSGESIEVSDPENATLVKGGLYVFYRSDPAEEFPDRWRTCSYLHIAAIDGAVKT